MANDPKSIFETLPGYLSERTRTLNRRAVQPQGQFVLYWMHHAARGHENPALDAAVWAGNRLRRPVLVYQGLGGRHIYNSDRHHTFIMEGAREVQRELSDRGIAYTFCLSRDPEAPTPLGQLAGRAALCVTEDFPAPPFPDWSDRLAAACPAAFWAVDTACNVPMQSLNPYERAYRFRQDNRQAFESRVRRPWADIAPEVESFSGPLGFEGVDLAAADIAELCAGCRIDHTVGPVAHSRGGSAAGYDRWEAFLRHGLADYARLRNDAAVVFPAGVSRMSAYLHHGQVSPFRIARQAATAGGEGAEKFLDELLVWRELAHNFCFHQRRPGTLEALPEWAQKTLAAHRGDARSSIYTRERLARGLTGDPLWDAAQHSLMIHGELHNNVRMTWGKAILQWTSSPEEALAVIIELNHRYALDGSDPSSYGGILWCLGLFDRPFPPARPVIGTLRPRSTQSHAARLDMPVYTAKVFQPASGAPKRVAVIGAGVSGLAAARTLSDHGHRVTLFEKARAPGGRLSTRRSAGFAFDHGAQYFTVRDVRFARAVADWRQAGVVQPWQGRIGVVADGQIRPERRAHQRFVGVPGMSAVSRHLADSLEVRPHTEVAGVGKRGTELALLDGNGRCLHSCDVLLVSIPPAQSALLLEGLSTLSERIRAVRLDPCWAAMLAFDRPLNLPFDGFFVHDAPLTWTARNSSKPGRGRAECWVLHAGGSWSAAHLEHKPAEVASLLAAAFFAATGLPEIEPVFAAAHLWRHAQARNPLAEGCLWDRRGRIGICGDWCSGSRIEGAYLSGASLAGRVLGDLATCTKPMTGAALPA
jgi:photolyase PhrII